MSRPTCRTLPLLLAVLTVFTCSCFYTNAETITTDVGSSDSLRQIHRQYREYLLTDTPSTDVDPETVQRLIDQQKPDGSWPSIDYTDQTRGGWRVAQHLAQLLTMAKLYNADDSQWCGDPALKRAILLGIDHWIERRYVCPNWWYNQIGGPMWLVDVTLLMQDELSDEQLDGALEYISQAKFGMTGQNSVWKAGIVFTRALIQDDQPLALAAREIILKDLKVTTDEGLQPDNSFHQHGPQLQLGNYGLSFASDMTRWGLIWHDTDFALTDDRVELLNDYVLKGLHWTLYKGQMDISSCGRQLFPGQPARKAESVMAVARRMQSLDQELADWYDFTSVFPSGCRHFWRSDYAVQQVFPERHWEQENPQPRYMTSVKMSSNRTIGTETCNSENMQGYFLGDGANYVYVNGDEYTDIFPVWDWRHLPGVTCLQNPGQSLTPQSRVTNKSDFVGGLSRKGVFSGEDGLTYTPGVATMDYNRDGLRAKKSWFFFPDSIACLGAGITSDEPHAVHTTINQCHLNGSVYVWIDGQRIEHPVDELGEYKNAEAIWHNKVSYRFPEPTSLYISTVVQKGSWSKVRTPMSKAEVAGPIFKLWLDHGVRPDCASYAYITAPDCKPELPGKDAVEAPGNLTILSNTSELQHIATADKKQGAASFHKPSKIEIPAWPSITPERPVVLAYNELRIEVTDPSQEQEKAAITFGKDFSAIVARDRGQAKGFEGSSLFLDRDILEMMIDMKRQETP